METERDIISSDAKLSAIAGLMFFAPAVKSRLKSDYYSEDEKKFIYGYVQVWYLNLVFLIITLISALVNFFRVNWILYRITTIWAYAIYIISVFSIFACANDLSMRSNNESIVQKIPHKWLVLKAYMPIINFILRFRQESYNMPYWRLKESVLLRTFFIFWTLLLWNSFGMWILIIIAVRIILLMLNIDIVPLSMKKAINSKFSCNPWEIFAYFFAPIVSKIKKTDYETVLQARKQSYQQWQNFWIWTIIQYILFIGILFLLYRWIDISFDNTILFIAMVLWIIRVIMFCVYKKALLRIPILSEIISLIFH